MACNGKNIKVLYNPHGFSFLKQDDSILKRRIYWILEKIAAHRKCTIIGVSKGEYDEALKLSKNSICINNGVNIDEIEKIITNKNKKTDNDMKICTIGRIGHQKNPEMFNKIAEKFPDIPFTWIGDGELREKLKAKNITITGWKTREEALKLVDENDIFILPSLWEGLPMALLEAMYLKKKCLVSNVVGNRDVIENGRNGFICNDVEDFSEKINRILNKDIDINEMEFNQENDVIEKYSTQKMCEEYRKIYAI